MHVILLFFIFCVESITTNGNFKGEKDFVILITNSILVLDPRLDLI